MILPTTSQIHNHMPPVNGCIKHLVIRFKNLLLLLCIVEDAVDLIHDKLETDMHTIYCKVNVTTS